MPLKQQHPTIITSSSSEQQQPVTQKSLPSTSKDSKSSDYYDVAIDLTITTIDEDMDHMDSNGTDEEACIQITKECVSKQPTIMLTKPSPLKKEKSGGFFVHTSTAEEQQLVDNILKSGDCKVRVARIPTSILVGGGPNQLITINTQRTSSVSASAFLAEQQRRLTKDFSSQMVAPPKMIVSSSVSNNNLSVAYGTGLAKITPLKPSSSYSHLGLSSMAAGTAATGMCVFPISLLLVWDMLLKNRVKFKIKKCSITEGFSYL